MMKNKRLLVVSAHAADYVWRAGGTIARYLQEGAWVKVIVLSLGARGESNDLWKQDGIDEKQVKKIRLTETQRAAEYLGISDFDCWDLEDYPIRTNSDLENRLLGEIRHMAPDIILTHDKFDVLNPDHNSISKLVFECSVMSNSRGVRVEGTKVTKQMAIFGFEPHQTELSGYKPGCFIDITAAMDQKVAAMKCFQAQKHLIEYYTQRAFTRGNHARRLSGDQTIQYAESFSTFFPYVSQEFVVRE